LTVVRVVDLTGLHTQIYTAIGQVASSTGIPVKMTCWNSTGYIYSGADCSDKQNLAISISLGFISLLTGLFVMIMFLYADHSSRLTDFIRRKVAAKCKRVQRPGSTPLHLHPWLTGHREDSPKGQAARASHAGR
jgi:hypothetical protein